jgi:hypothetical protein
MAIRFKRLDFLREQTRLRLVTYSAIIAAISKPTGGPWLEQTGLRITTWVLDTTLLQIDNHDHNFTKAFKNFTNAFQNSQYKK